MVGLEYLKTGDEMRQQEPWQCNKIRLWLLSEEVENCSPGEFSTSELPVAIVGRHGRRQR
jgi:hypothetical protein